MTTILEQTSGANFLSNHKTSWIMPFGLYALPVSVKTTFIKTKQRTLLLRKRFVNSTIKIIFRQPPYLPRLTGDFYAIPLVWISFNSQPHPPKNKQTTFKRDTIINYQQFNVSNKKNMNYKLPSYPQNILWLLAI